MRLRLTVLLFLLLASAGAAPLWADTAIGGAVNTNTALLASDSPYRVTSDLLVQNGATLSIQAGVIVYVDPGVNIVVQTGSLRADGTELDPILITSSADDGTGTPAAGDWGALRFENNTNDAGTRMVWTTVRYGTGVEIESASPRFTSCTFDSMSGAAITIDLASFPTGIANSAVNCGLNGIAVPPGDITDPGSWSLRGIPYVVQGRVSVGESPTVTSITPDTLQRFDSANVLIGGTRLAAATDVQIAASGVTAAIVAAADDLLTLQVDVAEDADLGAHDFLVITPAGDADSAGAGLTLTIDPPLPTLDSIAPDTVVAGGSSFTLTANGSRFAVGVEAVLDGTPLPTTRVSDTQLTADVDAALFAAVGNLPVIVRNPDPLNAGMFLDSLPIDLVVEEPAITLAPDPLLVISNEFANLVLSVPLVAPAGGLTFDLASGNATVAAVPAQVTILEGSSSVPVTVTGGTTGSTTVTASRAGFVSAQAQIDVVPPPILVPVELLIAPAAGVDVGMPGGVSDDLVVNPFLTEHVGVTVGPALFSVTPDRGTQGDSGLAVTATGTGLDDVTTVEIEPSDGVTVDGAPVVAPDGSTVDFSLTLAADAPATLRKVLLRTASGTVTPVTPESNLFRVTRPAPSILSIAPFNIEPGTVTTLTVNGEFLQGATALAATPPDGIIFGSNLSVDTAGVTATVDLQIDGAAPLGPRVITITTPGGTSSATGEPANTLNVVADIGTLFTPLIAPIVGATVAEPPGPGTTDFPVNPLQAQSVGVVTGSAITGVNPSTAIVGTANLDLTIEGFGLDAATGVTFEPGDGITINGAPVAAPDGLSIALNVTLASDAPTTPRIAVVQLPSGTPAATPPGADRFTITLPAPQIQSLLPNRGLQGAAFPLTINGLDLTGATAVAFEPPDGLTVAAPSVSVDGKTATVDLIIDPAAPLGQRVVRITTPGGTSTATGSPANLFEVSDDPGSLFTPLLAPIAGVNVGTAGGPGDPTDIAVMPVLAPIVGVVVGEPAPPSDDFPVTPALAPTVGITVGAAVSGVEPASAVPGAANLDVVVSGVNLDGVTTARVEPADDITINGAPVVAPDGSSVTINISIELGAARGYRGVILEQPAGVVPAREAGDNLIFVGDPPTIASIDPNIVAIGSAFTLVINGTDFNLASSVDFLPADDIVVGAPVVNVDGTQITVGVALAGAITPGARVVTVTTPAGTSSTTADVGNTLNIVSSTASLAPSTGDAPGERQPAMRPVESGPAVPAGSLPTAPSNRDWEQFWTLMQRGQAPVEGIVLVHPRSALHPNASTQPATPTNAVQPGADRGHDIRRGDPRPTSRISGALSHPLQPRAPDSGRTTRPPFQPAVRRS